jgi:RimJ/RimL family protein N-acetyltransferase
VACVDLANDASARVLEKLGFQVVSISPGRAGDVLTLELPPVSDVGTRLRS